MLSRKTLLLGVTFALLLALTPKALAFGTHLWRIDTTDLLERGELDQVAVTSMGEVKLGRSLERVSLSDVALVWSAAESPSGDVFLGTGNNGKILRLKSQGSAVEEVATTEAIVVSALAFGHDGELFAGTLPGGKIYRVPTGKTKGPAKAELFTKLDRAEHVWALRYDTKRKVLFAATGPEGVVYAVDRSGRAEVFYDALDDHVLSLLLEPGGALLAGTSPSAKLLSITGPGRATALHDFDGTEVKGIARQGESVYVAVNTFPSPPAPPKTSSSKSKTSRTARPKPGKGKVLRRLPDGSVESLLDFPHGHLTDLAAPGDGLVYAAAGNKGRVLTVDDQRVVSTVVDVEERQVLVLSLGGKSPIIGTGDAGAIYRVGAGVKGVAEYRTAPLDAAFVSRWGALEWRASGTLVVQTRSGNTEDPDQTWSGWSAPMARSGAPVQSPAARYLQVRVRWSRDGAAVLRALSIYHLPTNQRPVVTSVNIASPVKSTRPTLGGGSKSKSKAKRAKSSASKSSKAKRSPVLKVSWKVDNPDRDRLRYRLYVREEAETVWQPLLAEDHVLTKTSYSWNTDSVPEGHYLLKVHASDELDNPRGRALAHEKLSPPVVVDNDPPRLGKLVVKGHTISGQVEDGFSAVGSIEYSLDGRAWHPVFPTDELFDTRRETFSLELPATLSAGRYTVAVRAFDRARNQVTSRVAVTIR